MRSIGRRPSLTRTTWARRRSDRTERPSTRDTCKHKTNDFGIARASNATVRGRLDDDGIEIVSNENNTLIVVVIIIIVSTVAARTPDGDQRGDRSRFRRRRRRVSPERCWHPPRVGPKIVSTHAKAGERNGNGRQLDAESRFCISAVGLRWSSAEMDPVVALEAPTTAAAEVDDLYGYYAGRIFFYYFSRYYDSCL